MALKAVIAKLEDVAESVRGEYKAVDGKYVLQVDGMVSEDEFKTLETKLGEFRDNNIALNKKFKDVDPEKYRTLETENAELKKKVVTPPQTGDIEARIQAAIEKATTPLETKVTAMQTERDEARRALETKDLQDKLWAIGEKAGVRSESKKFWLQEATPIAKIDGDRIVIVRRDDKGNENPVFSKKRGGAGDVMTAEEWALEVAPLNPELSQFYGASTGADARNDKKQTQDGKRLLPNDPEAVSRNLADIASGKAVVSMH